MMWERRSVFQCDICSMFLCCTELQSGLRRSGPPFTVGATFSPRPRSFYFSTLFLGLEAMLGMSVAVSLGPI